MAGRLTPYKRIIRISKKPTTREFKIILKITGMGMAIIGITGFGIFLLGRVIGGIV